MVAAPRRTNLVDRGRLACLNDLMDQLENTTSDLLLGIARVVQAEAEELDGRERKVLLFLVASVLDAQEALTGSDA